MRGQTFDLLGSVQGYGVLQNEMTELMSSSETLQCHRMTSVDDHTRHVIENHVGPV